MWWILSKSCENTKFILNYWNNTLLQKDRNVLDAFILNCKYHTYKGILKLNLLSVGQEPSILLQDFPLEHITVQLYIQPFP